MLSELDDHNNRPQSRLRLSILRNGSRKTELMKGTYCVMRRCYTLFEKKRKCMLYGIQAEVNNLCMYFSRPRNVYMFVITYILVAFEYVIVHSRWVDLISVVRRQSHELYTPFGLFSMYILCSDHLILVFSKN